MTRTVNTRRPEGVRIETSPAEGAPRYGGVAP
jgi:hypothetical protein